MAEVRGVNRYLGGTRIALDFLSHHVESTSGTNATLLDVGTGTGDIPLALAAWARSRSLNLHITATDVSEEILELAHRHLAGRGSITLQAADATKLPYTDESFDFVTCNLALHHFPPDAAVLVLSEMYRVARRAILINDLERGRVGWWSARLLFGVITRDPLTSHDGPLSVLRAYTVEEIEALAKAANIPNARARRRPMFRLELVAEKAGAGANPGWRNEKS
jgi:SAM-dependent methyltransferase